MTALNPLRYRGYVCDEYTGWYYLQSRYYNPKLCRFINADSLIPEIDSEFSANNLFQYCWNNPVILKDGAGTSPTGALALYDYQIIHKIVQAMCSASKGWITEVYVSGAEGIGYLDLYDPVTNQYYEVKSERAAKRKATRKQMEKYDISYIKDWRIANPPATSPTRGNDYVSGYFQYGVYDVYYEYKGNGLITYRTEYNYERSLKLLATAAAAAVSIFAIYSGAGAVAGIPAFAAAFA